MSSESARRGAPHRAPQSALRLLETCLAHHPAGPCMIGDLLEDWHDYSERFGVRRAQLWFYFQAIGLGLGTLFFRHWHRLEKSFQALEIASMIEAISPRGWTSDLKQALRSLRNDPGLVFFSVLITGLGVGATTAVFSVMSPLLLKPLPFDEPESLVWIQNQAGEGRSAVTSRTANLRDFRTLSKSFESIAGYNAFFEQESYTLTGEGEPERLAGVGVTDGFFEVLGVDPLLGRSFTDEEAALWDDSAVMLSYSFWQQRFGGDRSLVGRTLTINGGPSTVVGILPPSFDFASIFSPSTRVDLLTTFPVNDETDRWGNTVSMIGRLAPGSGIDEARAEMTVILEQLKEQYPERWGLNANLMPLRDVISGDHRSALLLLFGAAASVLLIVCVNLSSLLLSKGIRRRKEMFLRAALGAPRGRLLRLLLLESLLLSIGGALFGVGLAHLITRAVAESSGVAIPMLASARVDSAALIFSCVAALVTGLAVGTLPAIQASGAGASGALRSESRTLTSSRGSRFVREGLVIGEMAVACALLVVGALMVQSFSKVLQVDLGFQPTPLAAWLIDTDRSFETVEQRVAFFDSVAEEVRSLPGVEAVALTDAIPLGINRQWGLGIVGRESNPESSEAANAAMFPHIVDRHYLPTMGIPLLAGRGFEATDHAEADVVGVINETAALKLFPGPDGGHRAVGEALSLGETQIEIVGVVGDVKHLGLEKGSGYQLYLPMVQISDFGTLDLVVRSSLPLESIQGGVAAALRKMDANMPTNDVRTLGSVVDRAVSPRRFTLTLLSGFAGVAVLLAAIGIYGVLSYSVAERSREIAIRMALGEQRGQVRGRVLARTLALAGIGSVLGIALSLMASRLVASLLYEVEPTHVGTLVTIPLVLLLVAAVAGVRPALRASRVEALGVLQRS